MPESTFSEKVSSDQVSWNDDGLAPAIVQHERSGEVLMMAWMNPGSPAVDSRHGSGALLVPFPATTLEKRRDQRQYAHPRPSVLGL